MSKLALVFAAVISLAVPTVADARGHRQRARQHAESHHQRHRARSADVIEEREDCAIAAAYGLPCEPPLTAAEDATEQALFEQEVREAS